jgi:hypothetical protein
LGFNRFFNRQHSSAYDRCNEEEGKDKLSVIATAIIERNFYEKEFSKVVKKLNHQGASVTFKRFQNADEKVTESSPPTLIHSSAWYLTNELKEQKNKTTAPANPTPTIDTKPTTTPTFSNFTNASDDGSESEELQATDVDDENANEFPYLSPAKRKLDTDFTKDTCRNVFLKKRCAHVNLGGKVQKAQQTSTKLADFPSPRRTKAKANKITFSPSKTSTKLADFPSPRRTKAKANKITFSPSKNTGQWKKRVSPGVALLISEWRKRPKQTYNLKRSPSVRLFSKRSSKEVTRMRLLKSSMHVWLPQWGTFPVSERSFVTPNVGDQLIINFPPPHATQSHQQRMQTHTHWLHARVTKHADNKTQCEVRYSDSRVVFEPFEFFKVWHYYQTWAFTERVPTSSPAPAPTTTASTKRSNRKKMPIKRRSSDGFV